MDQMTIEMLNECGISVDCESPIEISKDGWVATGVFALVIINCIRTEHVDAEDFEV